jgi:hypothetical protein
MVGRARWIHQVGPGGWVAQGALQVRPCKLGRRIHAAHAPAQPTHPATDTLRRRPTTESTEESKSRNKRGSLRSVDPRHAWMAWTTVVPAAGRHLRNV